MQIKSKFTKQFYLIAYLLTHSAKRAKVEKRGRETEIEKVKEQEKNKADYARERDIFLKR